MKKSVELPFRDPFPRLRQERVAERDNPDVPVRGYSAAEIEFSIANEKLI
jgi:hypothetical protein